MNDLLGGGGGASFKRRDSAVERAPRGDGDEGASSSSKKREGGSKRSNSKNGGGGAGKKGAGEKSGKKKKGEGSSSNGGNGGNGGKPKKKKLVVAEDDVDLEAGDGAGAGAGEEGEEEAGADPHMEKFFADINDIKDDLQAMRKRLRTLQELNDKSKLVTKAKDMKDIKNKMEAAINTVLKVAKGIKGKLEQLDHENMVSRKRPGCEEGTGTDRTRMSITMTHKKKLKDLMVEFQELRSKIQQEYKETVERRYYTVTGEKPDPELVDQLIETGDGEAIFQRAIEDQGRGQLTDAIAEIQERSDAVKDIEAQLRELHQVFLDMAVLVESQGELLDNIESNVDSAKDHVTSGVKQLEVARKHQLNTRKWIIVGIVALIIIIILIIVFALKPWTWK